MALSEETTKRFTFLWLNGLVPEVFQYRFPFQTKGTRVMVSLNKQIRFKSLLAGAASVHPHLGHSREEDDVHDADWHASVAIRVQQNGCKPMEAVQQEIRDRLLGQLIFFGIAMCIMTMTLVSIGEGYPSWMPYAFALTNCLWMLVPTLTLRWWAGPATAPTSTLQP